jgi:AcrR family transcriptional regulator
MGRRSSHTPDELRELILHASTGLIEREGLGGLSARAIARVIEYSPGTLYNVFSDLDDLILTIEQRLLDRLAVRLSDVKPNADPVQHICDLAAAYLSFTQERPRLWNLLLEHHMPKGWEVPESFKAKLEALLGEVERAIQPLLPPGDTEGQHQAARVLWASVHGITSLATADKLTNVTADSAPVMVEALVRTYCSGLQVASAKQRPRRPR